MEPGNNTIILQVNASFAGSVGYGNVYKCEVIKIIKGDIREGEITITIMANDKLNDAFVQSHLNKTIEIGLKMRARGEPYTMAPISGFVDNSRLSWEIEYIKEVS
jgi:hypothetical protein